ncbi:EF-P beta-lysylation protein EpmB [Microbulbifer thermotolerans]|uniref:L-lysine 2,3-aminomutase n=1 Tax=Microbulbifer thermotolerans TaxID=252514 RepID=A0A143HIW3_MICTH|nr:EF-P beta-lysylation protein EpmB [Microbulbifer thermotolerans]AMX01446.1 EF-P beta-lysylation protein EpmB [Microbulbifer thermotolerans]MCX2778286.1 EF-P beta-lysylation protein EpmB [Microbulbifer thermotolerans]MCX2781991.1 EF-P beta-lysylation protein EpmB [Microbulbifer thermotolerans]MCX2783251.1 EF-P beta-lysylation protein EpmB [Microbulbifer thermotolerans]MCX2796303.1 EF-P beta-lysylation protein EpmB [Microbulbifer thermotolerans]
MARNAAVGEITVLEQRRWQEELADLVTDPAELIELLGLDPAQLPQALRASGDFPLRVPRPFLKRMRRRDPSDPLLLQVLPGAPELQVNTGFSADPLDEARANPVPGVVHKYRGRLLLIAAGQCAVNCRYCFRRQFPYGDNHLSGGRWQEALDYIRERDELREVILSGGDPLVLGDRQLARLTQELAEIEHLDKLRVHSRLPIVVPSRITDELVHWFTSTRLKPVLVLHCNHANEIDGEVQAALAKLRAGGVTLLNQAVLLRGVNDSVGALADLSEALFDAGVLPYYLHQLDRVQGAAHFEVETGRAQWLVEQLRNRMPGYLVPRLVREIPGQRSKSPL